MISMVIDVDIGTGVVLMQNHADLGTQVCSTQAELDWGRTRNQCH